MKKLSLITSLFFSLFMYPQDPTFLWVKSIGGAIAEKGVHSATDVSENLYLTGSFEGTVDFDPGAGVQNLTAVGNKDIYIVKLDPNGGFVWGKSIGSMADEASSSITVDESRNIYITGDFEGTVDFDSGDGNYPLKSHGGKDIFVQKLNPDGNLIFAFNIGGSMDDYGGIVKTDEDGNLYLLHSFADKADLDPGKTQALFASHGGQDIALQKFNSNGRLLWAKAFGGVGFDRGNDMVLDAERNIFITGSFQHEMDFDPSDGAALRFSKGYSDVFLEKFRTDGSMAWVRCMGGEKGDDIGTSLKLDNLGNIYSIGSFDGQIVYTKAPETTPKIPQVMMSNGGIDMYVQKLNDDGMIEFMKPIGNRYNDFGKEIYLDPFGNIMIIGEFMAKLNSNLEDKSKTAYSSTKKGIFIEQLTENGATAFHKEIANSAVVSISSLAYDYSNSIYLVGYFEESVDFDPGPAIHSVSAKETGATYILKLSPYGNVQYLKESTLAESVSTYPNPVKNKLTIDLGKKLESTSLTIFDVVGNLVKRTESKDCSEISLDLNLNPGIYYVNISSENNTITKKIIVE